MSNNPFYQPGARAEQDIREWFGPSDIDDIIELVQHATRHAHGRGALRTAFLIGQLQHLHEAVTVYLERKSL